MFTITMSTRGQFVLPKDVRERLQLLPGCKVEGTIDEQGRLVLVPSLHEPDELFRDRPPVTFKGGFYGQWEYGVSQPAKVSFEAFRRIVSTELHHGIYGVRVYHHEAGDRGIGLVARHMHDEVREAAELVAALTLDRQVDDGCQEEHRPPPLVRP